MRYPKTRLSLLMFIQFFIWGATGPILSLYLRDCLGFSGAQVGLILGLSALGSIFSPAFMSFVADRFVSSERLLCLLNAVGGACMFVFSRQTGWYQALAIYIVYQVVVSPMSPLINAITFHHSPSERRKFGNIRVWGTVGWIAVAWFASFGLQQGGAAQAAAEGGSKLPLLLDISAITSFVMAAYCLTIPKRGRAHGPALTPDESPTPESISVPTSAVSTPVSIPADELTPEPAPAPRPSTRAALRVVLRPQVLALAAATAAITFVDKFYNVGTSPFLRSIGLSEQAVMPAMSLGQVPEIAAMGILGYLLTRFGAKRVLLLGVAMEIFRFAACAAGFNMPLVYAALCVHGLAYTFTMVTAVICLDGFCDARERSGVHQLFNVATAGIGGFLGSYAAGWTMDLFTDAAGSVNYRGYWAAPLAISILVFITIAGKTGSPRISKAAPRLSSNDIK
ncbi:MAG: MFS transporter [Chitinispirillales bacterium]|jgi:MFS family permease|nr:MFS transporter [Chitinispirillales bacterium]